MDNFEPNLRKVIVKAVNQKRRDGGSGSRYEIAPRAALLTASGATIGAGKLRLYLFSEAVRTFTGLL
jgi:hypothetical protein